MTARWAVAGTLATAIGVTASASPPALTRAFGLPASAGTGAGALSWRLFGVRTAVIGAAVLRGDPRARAAVLPVQLLDQAAFWHALATGSIPRRSGLLAAASSAVLIVLSRPTKELT